MKTVSRTLVLCVALASSLAQANEPEEPRVPFQVLMGAAGTLAVSIPTAYAGYLLFGALFPPTRYCDHAGCDTLGAGPSLFGLLAGGFVGLSLGSGLGVATAGHLVGRPFQLWPASGGAALGGVLGLVGAGAASTLLISSGQAALIFAAYLLIPAGAVAGAVTGAIWWYEAGLQPPPVKVTPTVALVPGGGVAGIAGTF